MPARFTIGIEEEFQLVDRKSGELAPAFHGMPFFEKTVNIPHV